MPFFAFVPHARKVTFQVKRSDNWKQATQDVAVQAMAGILQRFQVAG